MRAIVNLVTSTTPHINAQRRLIESYRQHHATENCPALVATIGESQIGSPAHSINPYAFKIYAIQQAILSGYKQILWVDASIVFVRNSQPIFDWIEENGVFMEEAGHYVGTWCNDRTLEYFGISRAEANQMPMFSAGFTGIDITNPKGLEFFNKWRQSMLDGQFVGSWSDHRHDMTCGSIIANQMGLNNTYSSGGNYFAYVGSGYSKPKETVICHLLGI